VRSLLASPEHRSLWAELPQVKESGLLPTLDPAERRLQEAIFEIVSSEASYLKSLNVLVFHFASSAHLSAGPNSLLSPEDRAAIFSNVVQVTESCSTHSVRVVSFPHNLQP
jgi:neuronal guanine nucleotide exchange factor